MNPVHIKLSVFHFGHSVIVLFQTYKNKVYFLPLKPFRFQEASVVSACLTTS